MNGSPQKKRRGAYWRYALYAIVLFSLLLAAPMEAIVSIEAIVQVGFHLAVGWIIFLVQSSRLAIIDGALLASFFIGLGVVIASGHAVMRHLMRQRSASGRCWQWKWTSSLVAVPLIFFGVCVSMQGAVTTSGWLFSGPLDEGYSRGLRKSFAGRLARFGKMIAEAEGKQSLPNSLLSISAHLEGHTELREIFYIYRDPEINDVPEYWTWLGGVKLNSPGDVPVAFAPRAQRGNVRVVGFLDGTAKECTEEEWQAALQRWRQAVKASEEHNVTEAAR